MLAVITLGCSQQEQDTVSGYRVAPPQFSGGDERLSFQYMGMSGIGTGAPIPMPVDSGAYPTDRTATTYETFEREITPQDIADTPVHTGFSSNDPFSVDNWVRGDTAGYDDSNWSPASLDNSEGMDARAMRSRLESLLGSSTSSPGSMLSGYLSQRFFNHQAASLSPDASISDRVQGEFAGLLVNSLQRQAEQQASSTVDALFAGDEVDGLLADAMATLQVGLANDAINRGLDGLRGLPGAAFQNLEGEFIVRKGQAPEYALTTIQPIYESLDQKHTVFSQISARTQDDEHTGNLGFAYRRMTDDRKYLIGANTFVDYELPDDHARMSIGLDAMTSLLSINANRYWPLTGWRDTDNGYQERGMAGWDGGITGRLQNFPDIQLAARGYLWEREGEQGNLRGAEAGFDYSPVPALKFGIRAGRDSDEDLTMTSLMSFRWLFGTDAEKQLRRSSYNLDDVSGRRFDKVQRENRILKETRQNPALTARVSATVGANTAQRPDGSTVNLAVGQQLPFGTRITVANTAGAIAELAYGSGATLIIGQDSVVTVDGTNVTLFQGIMRFISGSTDITITVPGGVINLIGTDVDVRTIGTRTTARVRDGEIRADATNGTQSAQTGETILIDGGTPSQIAFTDPDAELHRNEAHAKLDRAGQNVITSANAAPYVTDTPAVNNFTGSTFDIVLPFSKAVTVTGTPVLSFTIGGVARTATYSSGSGTVALSFSYSAAPGDAGFDQFVMDELSPEGSIVTTGNSSQQATLTVLPETVPLPGPISGGGAAPTVTSITPSGITTAADPIVFTVSFSENVTGFDASDPIVMNGTVTGVTAINGAQYTVDVSPTADGAVSLMIPANSAINGGSVGNTASATVSVTSDRTAPAGYSVAFTDPAITTGNQTNASIDINTAEIGATVSYSITSSGGGTAVTGSLAAPAASFTIAGLDLSGLGDGTLTLSVVLQDAYGNIGLATTATTSKATTGGSATAMTGPAAGNYAASANLDFTITFAGTVTVTSTPRLTLDMGGSTVYALYTGGTGTNTLTFRRTVIVPDAANPLAFDSTLIDLNGGSIIETATLNAINPDFSSVAPSLAGVIVDTAAPAGYSIAFDGPVNGANAATAGLTMSGLETGATYALSVSSDNGGTPVTNNGTVTAATMPVTLDLSGLNDGTLSASLSLTDAAGNVGAPATGSVAKSTTAVSVLVSTPLTLTNANPIPFTITFSEAVSGLTLTDFVVVNGTASAPTTSDNITWQTTVIPAADGTVSLQVAANAVTNGIGTPNVASNIASTQSDRTPPAGQSVAFASPVINSANAATAGVNLASLEIGASYSLSITSSGGGTAVTSSGTAGAASVPLTLDLSGLGDGTLTAVLVMTDTAGNLAASVSSTATKSTSAPTITAMSAPANAYYNVPDPLTFTVTYSQAVTVTGTPRMALNMNGTTVYATYASGTGTTALTFTATVAAGQTANPLAFAATTIDLNGGSITATSSGNTAAVDFSGVAPIVSSIFVDTTAPTLNTITPPSNRVYVTGEAIFFTLTFSEPMLVTGTPRLTLTYGSTTIYANYVSGANTNTIGFSYVVQAGDIAPAGLTIANTVDLNGGSLTDRATNPPAALTFTAPNLSGVQMNVPSCAGGTVQLGASFLDGFCAGKVNIAGSDFDLIVAPSGCAYESGGNASTVPSGIFTPACSGTDSVTKIWADSTGASEGAGSVEDGITNTVNATNDPARANPGIGYCYNLNVNGRIDWYLPSRNELDVLRQNLGSFGLLGFAATTYWSSTETGTNTANIYDMTGGLSSVSKTDPHHIRCVRRITPPQIALNPNPAEGRENVAYSATIAATGGGGSLTFTLVSGTLPPGLTLDSVTGVISGTPTTAGVYPGLVVRASDSFGQSETNPFTITITGLPRCNSNTVTSGSAYAGGVCAATVTIGAQTYDLVATPSNCSYEPTGSSTSKPTANFTPTCTGTTDVSTKRFSSITGFNEQSGSNTDGIGNTLQLRYDAQTANAGAAYCYHMVYGGFDDWYLPSRDEALALHQNMYANAVGGFAATTYLTSTQNSTTNATTVDFTSGLAVANNKTTAYRTRCVRRVAAPLRIVQPALAPPDGAEGLAYSATFPASGGTGAITYSVATGTLPPGLTLDSTTGVVAGTPTLAGTYAGIVIRATDGAAATADTTAFTITVTGLARCNTGTVTAGTAYGGGICAGEVPNGGSPYDLVATVSRCAYEASGNSNTKPAADFTPACTGALDNVTKVWSDVAGTNEPANSTTDGLPNTQLLLGDATRVNPAAAYCYHLVHGGFNDWYLPSSGELDTLFVNLADKGLGGFAAANYHSSTQNNTTQNRYRNFSTGAIASSTKTTAQNIRCVRRVNPVRPLLLQTALTPPEGSQNLPFSMRIPATSGAGTLTFSLNAGTLPPGLTLNTATGFITGTPTAFGTYTGIVVGVSDGSTSAQTAPFTLTIVEVDACDSGNVMAGAAFGGGVCVGNVTVGAQTYDLITTPGNCNYESGGSSTTKPTANFTPTCNGATDSITKRWSIGTALAENASSTSDGAGNTLQLTTDDRRENPAAGYCDNMVYGGFDDWYLPARDELLELYNNLSSKSLGSFANTTYWSASESSASNAITMQAVTGTLSTAAKNSTTVPRVRCVRRADRPLRIAAAPIIPEAHEGVAYSYRIRATGGAGALTYSLTGGSLPAGITLNASTGVIAGTTTASGTYSGLIVTVSDGSTTASTTPFTLTVSARAQCAGGIQAGSALGGGICGGTIVTGGLPFDIILSPSGCGFEPSGTSTTKPGATFTPTCSGGTDSMTKRWGSSTTVGEGASSTTNGITNTLQLLSDAQSLNAAAAYCFHLSVGGFDDWYFPAEDEVEALYQNLGRWALGGMAYGNGISYWSSTEQANANARSQSFDRLGTHNNTTKTTATRVRCVRRN